MKKSGKVKKGSKGFELPVAILATVIMLMVIVLIIFMLYGSFSHEAGTPTSEFFFKMFDFITSWVS